MLCKRNNILLFLWTSILLISLPFFPVFGTHNRAGEITMRQVSDLTYEITITTFTYKLSGAIRSELEVIWGDNTTSIAKEVGVAIDLPNYYVKRVYKALHTYPGPGTYQVIVQDPNRNFGVKNIPNSVNVVFSVKTTISISPQLGVNSTPVLLNPPYDKAALGYRFIHNPAAYDEDGDSISYSLTICTEFNGVPITNYTFPKASDTLYVNPVTGDLIWDAPVDTGIYNIAMNIEEWRRGVKIGNIVRDMQIEVYKTTNNPPLNDSLPSLCVEAGNQIIYDITSNDPDGDSLLHFITGGPFAVGSSPSTTALLSSSAGSITSRFQWQTICEHARQQSYNVLVKTEDRHKDITLIDIDNMSINVIGPAPKNPQLTPSSNSIRVSWTPDTCSFVTGYSIYRRIGPSGYLIDSCTYGLPAFAGFTKVGTVKDHNTSAFNDNNSGAGLLQGTEYCYRIVAVYPDGSESYPSEEICTNLIPGNPSMLNASVAVSNAVSGEIFLSWIMPRDLDTIPANGPFEVIIKRSSDLWGQSLTEINRYELTDLSDTTYTDSGVNTYNFPYSYSVELYNNESNNRFLIGRPEIASTLFPSIAEQPNQLELSFINNVPWLNYEYVIYRSNTLNGVYDSLATSQAAVYRDNGLPNGTEFCYYAKAKGTREENGIIYYTENISHRVCGIPNDTIPPCPPELSVESICDSMFNYLVWTNPNNYCADDVVKYYIYYWASLDAPPVLIDSTLNAADTTYRHDLIETLAACYYVTAIDSFNNESDPSPVYCVDICFSYSIPNVFTPDGDNINDILRPIEMRDVEKIDMKIFNRWGQIVFETTDPLINWDGKYKGTDELVSPGVYYYICDVYERRLTGIEPRNITGFIHVYSEKGATINTD